MTNLKQIAFSARVMGFDCTTYYDASETEIVAIVISDIPSFELSVRRTQLKLITRDGLGKRKVYETPKEIMNVLRRNRWTRKGDNLDSSLLELVTTKD